jgi:hypothetical protein
LTLALDGGSSNYYDWFVGKYAQWIDDKKDLHELLPRKLIMHGPFIDPLMTVVPWTC